MPAASEIKKKWAICIIVITVGYVASLNRGPFPRNDSYQPPQTVETKMEVVAAYQDAEGATPSDLTMSFLKNMEQDNVERIREKVLNANPPSDERDKLINSMKSTSMYFEKDRQKLAILRVDSDYEKSKAVTVMGLLGGQAVRVVCVKKSAIGEISLVVGPCAEKISEVFGLSLRAKDDVVEGKIQQR